MPIAVPLAIAGAEYGLSTGVGLAAVGGAEAAAGMGTAAYSSFAAADALSATGAVSSLSGLQLAGLAVSTVGGVGQALQGKAAAESSKMNAQIAANNAVLANNNATAAAQEGEQNAASASQASKAKIGGVLAEQGASGVDVNSGSSADTRQSLAQVGELNAINIRADAARKAYGYQTQSVNDTAQASIDKSTATNTQISSGVTSAGTMLSGATNPNNPWGAYLASGAL
jgi:hypothetical protein